MSDEHAIGEEKKVRTALYRHFDAAGELLYVGISLSALKRLADHKEASHWFSQIARVEIEYLDSRPDALRAESEAIAKENPKFNVYRPRALLGFQAAIEASRQDLTRKIVKFDPIYDIREVANILRMTGPQVEALMNSGRLGFVSLPDKTKVMRRRVTGWQLIDFMESEAK